MRFKKLKEIFLSLVLLTTSINAQGLSLGDAKGLFFSLGVGPKFPIGEYSLTNGIGIGADITFSYTDNKILPVFFYTKLGYHHYPISNDLPKKSDYSSYMTNEYLVLPGIRFYLSPIIEDQILLMPVVEVGASIGFFSNTHIFKSESNKSNYDEFLTKFGFHVGGGFSIFLLETTLNYYFFPEYHSISLDLRIQIPIFARI